MSSAAKISDYRLLFKPGKEVDAYTAAINESSDEVNR